MNKYLSSRLKSQAGIRNAETVVAADAVGDAIDREIQRAIGKVIEYSQRAFPWQAKAALALLPNEIRRITTTQLAGLGVQAHRRTARETVRTLTTPYRVELARRRMLRESVDMLEDDPTGLRFRFDPETFTYQAPVIPDPATDVDAFLDLLFPPPSADEVRRKLEFLIPPMPLSATGSQGAMATEIMAQAMARVRSEGGNNRDVAKAILPFFDGDRARARRTARTYGLFIANEMHREISDGLGDLVAGRQVNNPGGENARPDHALRSGTIYWKRPKAGQWGYEVMPRPPWDTGRGPFEQGGGLKHSCRCWMADVLALLDSLRDNPVIRDAKGMLVPDVLTYEDWWSRATEKQRRAAVGTRRYDAMAAQTDRPRWADFITARGELLSVERIGKETAQQRADRRAKLDAVLRRNAKQRADVLQFGFVA